MPGDGANGAAWMTGSSPVMTTISVWLAFIFPQTGDRSAELRHDLFGEQSDDLLHLPDRHRPRAAEVAHDIAIAQRLQRLDLADHPFGVADDLELVPAEIVAQRAAFQVAILPELI